jgi:hypothetical protein
MFAACPHCHFLIALHPQSRVVPATCPRCGKQVDDGAPAPPETDAAGIGLPMPTGSSAAPAIADADAGAAVDADTAAGPAAADAATHKADDMPDEAGSVEKISDGSSEAEYQGNDSDRVATMSATETSVVATPRENPPSSDPAHAKTAIPNFTRTARTTAVQTRVPRWQWVAVIALSLLLAIQALLADRARLATDASWRPWVAQLCGVFRCSIPVWRQPEAFTMLSRDVRPVGDRPGTLQAQATFRNDARWAQAWPIVLLTLKDADGRTLGARALTPSEYLDAGQVQGDIAPGQSAQIAVRIREPSANVVAFSFDFR